LCVHEFNTCRGLIAKDRLPIVFDQLEHTPAQIILESNLLLVTQKKVENSSYEPDLISRTADEFLRAIINSRNKSRVLVQLKFRASNVGFEEWVTYKQYHFLKTLDCIEFCKISPLSGNW